MAVALQQDDLNYAPIPFGALSPSSLSSLLRNAENDERFEQDDPDFEEREESSVASPSLNPKTQEGLRKLHAFMDEKVGSSNRDEDGNRRHKTSQSLNLASARIYTKPVGCVSQKVFDTYVTAPITRPEVIKASATAKTDALSEARIAEIRIKYDNFAKNADGTDVTKAQQAKYEAENLQCIVTKEETLDNLDHAKTEINEIAEFDKKFLAGQVVSAADVPQAVRDEIAQKRSMAATEMAADEYLKKYGMTYDQFIKKDHPIFKDADKAAALEKDFYKWGDQWKKDFETSFQQNFDTNWQKNIEGYKPRSGTSYAATTDGSAQTAKLSTSFAAANDPQAAAETAAPQPDQKPKAPTPSPAV